MAESPSARKREANRQNARKSTGPATPEGKGRSRLNAYKHGLLARHHVVTAGPDPEVPEEFEDIVSDLVSEHQPFTPIQKMLLERFAACYWRLRRAARFEIRTINEYNTPYPDPRLEQALRLLGESPSPPRSQVDLLNDEDLNRLIRYESMIHRELQRNLTLLQRYWPDHPAAALIEEGETRSVAAAVSELGLKHGRPESEVPAAEPSPAPNEAS